MDTWIMRPFNTLFNLTALFFLLLLTVTSLLLRGKSERTKVTVLVAACIATMIGFIVYKYRLSQDSDFNVITAGMGGFNWWGELPMQLCNINMILIPIAVLKKSRPLMCFSFFLGPLGALMALAMPGNGFEGYPILLPRMLGYYGTHFMIVIEGLALVTFGLFRPRLRDLPRATLAICLIALGVFAVNMLLRWSGLHPKANYFFSVETEGNFLLEIFHGWIPIPFLYLIPSIAILAVYMLIITIPFEIIDRRREKNEKAG
ncbi:MAG: YwaF family protein [Oscillospiraceae bacterium]|nr:YwaF family protein [Oscillospiraceae bacterium]